MSANETTVQYAVNVGGNFEAQSNRDADAADRMADSIDDELKALKSMQAALRNLQGGSMGATKEALALKNQIAAQKTHIAASQLQVMNLGANWKRTSKATKDASADQIRGMRRMVSELQDSNSAIGSMLGNVRGLGAMLGKAGLAGAAALVVVAFAAVTAATFAATLALAKYALGVVDARRAEMIRLEGLTKIPNWFGIAAGKADQLQASLDRVSSMVAMGRDKLEGFATTLYKAGLRGKNLDAALEGTALRAAVLGDELGAAWGSMAAGAALTGQSVIAMAKKTRQQFGELAARQLLSFDNQLQKLRENVGILFRDVKIEGFLKKFATLTAMFTQSTATGRALKVMLEALLNPLFGSADSGAPILKRLFQGMVIGAQAAVIAVLKLRKWWNETFSGLRVNINWVNVAVYTGIGLFGLLAVTVAGLTATVATLVVLIGPAVGLLVTPFVLFGAAIIAVIYAFKLLIDGGKSALAYLKGLNWSEIGLSILLGITNPLGSLWSVGMKLGKQMLAGFKQSWEIRSPSKVAGRIVDRDIAGSMEASAKRAAPRVGEAIGSMAFPSRSVTAGAAQAQIGAGSSGGARGGLTLTIAELHVHPSGDDPKSQAREVVEEIYRQLEMGLVQLGGAY